MNSTPRHRRYLLRSPLVAGALLALALPFAAAASQNTATVAASAEAGATQNSGGASSESVTLPTFQIIIRNKMLTVAPQRGGVRGALHTAVVEINNDKGDRIQISRQNTANYLRRNYDPIEIFVSTLGGGAVRSFEVRATGKMDVVRTLTLHYEDAPSMVVTITQGRDYKAFNLVASNGGSLGISLKLYNRGSSAFTLDITPREFTVTHALPGTIVRTPVQISAIMPSIAGKKNTVLLMEARHAAYGFHFHQPNEIDGYFWFRGHWLLFPVRMTNFIRYGAETPEYALRRMVAAATPGDIHHYVIPPHAAKGFYENQISVQAGRFLSNKDAGTLAVDFRNALAHLHLKVHSFANTISGPSLLTEVGHLGDEFINFDSLALGGWGTLTAGIGDGYRVAISVVGSPDANVRFYGDRAQEIAGFFRYSSGGHMIRIGFIGIHPKGGVAAPRPATPAPASYAALSWDSADGGDASMTVHTNADGVPVSISVGRRSVVAFGTMNASTRVGRYFRNALKVTLRSLSDERQVLLVTNEAPSTIDGDIGNSTVSIDISGASGQASQSASSAVFSYIIIGEAAAFFFLSDNKDLRRARYGFFGVQTSPWVMTVLQYGKLDGVYTISAGKARGLAWNSGKSDDYFLRNDAAGKISVDFGGGVVTLNITVGATDKDGRYIDDFLKVTDFHMAIRGNVFNNYHCKGATDIASVACKGKIVFAGTYLTTYDAGSVSVSVGSVRVQAGGAFYGENTPRALAGGIAYYVGESSRKGMRLQFLGAGGLRNTASGGSPPDPHTEQVEKPAGSPALRITLPHLREARVRGAVHTAVVQISNESGGNIVIARQSTAGYLVINSFNLGTFTATLGGGTVQVQPLTLRGTGNNTVMRALTYHGYPEDDPVTKVLAQSGREKVFNLIAGGNGSLSLSLHIYKLLGGDYTLDITPGKVTLQHVLSTATVYETVQISALMPDIAGTKDTALLMEARYAAFGLNFDYAASGTGRLTNFFRYGAETSAGALQRMTAAAGGTYTYRIPRHAAKGYYENQTTPQLGRFLSNQDSGVLAVDFGSTLARLHLTMHSFANTIDSARYLTDYNRLGSVFIAFNGFVLGSWGTVTAGISNGGGYGSTAVIFNAISANVRFYGERAQEVAGFIKYISDDAAMRIGFLGINEKGGVAAPLPASVAVSYAALRWDKTDGSSSMTVHVDASGAPVSLLIEKATVAFGSLTSGHVYRCFRNTPGAMLRPSDAGMIIGENPGLTISVHDVTVVRGALSSTYAVDMKSYRSADSASFSYVVSGADAAFFYIMDDLNISKARAGFYGVQTPLWVMQGAGFEGVYTIPVGGAQGFAWNGEKAKDYFLHNKAAGALGVDFGKLQATLGITLDAADMGGAYTDGFLEIADFQMTIRGNVFNNYHCTGKGSTGCSGRLVFTSDRYLENYNGSSRLGSVHAGGAFYGESAPNAVAGGIAYYVGDGDNKGMRLQFLGVARVLSDIASSAASTVNMATKVDGSVVSTAGLSVLVSSLVGAEYAAFAASGSGSDLRMAHYGTRTAPAILSTMAKAFYRIAAKKASGTYTNAGGTVALTLRNSTAGELQVNFQKSQAELDLTFQDSSGEGHKYILRDIGLLIESNGFRFCPECGGSIDIAGDLLKYFNDAVNFQLNGAFYGTDADLAAGVLRQTDGNGGVLDLGFIGKKE